MRAGSVLLEVLVAIVILSVAAGTAVTQGAAVTRDRRVLGEREREMWAAERALIASALLTRAELEQRLGERAAGDFVVRIDRPEPDLFRISVSPLSAPERELLATVVHRPRLLESADET